MGLPNNIGFTFSFGSNSTIQWNLPFKEKKR